MEHTVEEYAKAKPVAFPLRHSSGFVLDECEVFCNQCGQPTTEFRGTVIEFPTCLDMEIGGRCRPCSFITWSRSRYYGDRLLHWGKASINEYPNQYTWWERIRRFFRF